MTVGFSYRKFRNLGTEEINGGEQKTIEYNEKQSKMIFESPDGGETVYSRKFNQYEKRTKIKDPRDISKDE